MATNLELLHKIQEAAVDSSTPVSESLRRCKILSMRVGVTDLTSWLDHELSGYPPDTEVPHYRVVTGTAKGHFMGSFGRSLTNWILPAGHLDPALRSWAESAALRHPIATLEATAADDTDGVVMFKWPGDLVVLVRNKFIRDMNLVDAQLEVPRSGFKSVVEVVRNRMLSFALDLESKIGATEDPVAVRETASQVFVTQIFGPVTNLSQAGGDISNATGASLAEIASLIAALREHGVSEQDTTTLRAAITEDGPRKDVGPRVGKWIGEMVSKASSGAGKIAFNTATTLIPKLIAKHYGIDV